MKDTEKKCRTAYICCSAETGSAYMQQKNRKISQKYRFLLYKSGKSKLAYVLQYILASKATGNWELKNTYEKRKEKEK